MTTRLLNLPAIPKWWTSKITLFVIVLISVLLHAWSVWQLPVDYDEPVYLKAGQEYAHFIKNGDLRGIINYQGNREHPPLTKLLYSIPYLISNEQPDSDFPLYAARSISALFGILAVYFLARRNLWAGFFMAFHSMTLKYTSQAYLEALPMLMVILATLSLEKAEQKRNKYFWLSAIFFGLAGAAKYPYLIVALVLLYMLIHKRGFHLREISIYFFTALITFLIFNPNFWISPLAEVVNAVNFHITYSHSLHVQLSNYPWYQPIMFLAASVPWHPQVFFFLTLDEFIFWIAFVGLYWEIKDRKWESVWLIVVLIFLLIWPTKWPQYTLMLTPALTMVAGNSVRRAIAWIQPKEDYWNYLEEMLPTPPRITWWILVIFVAGLLFGKVVYEYQLAYARRGWETFNSHNSPLLSDFVLDINTKKEGVIAIGTREGLQLWNAKLQVPIWGEDAKVIDSSNSDLPSSQINSIAYDPVADTYWLGTEFGVSKLADGIVNYGSAEIGCENCKVNELVVDQDSQVWVATNEGIFLFTKEIWQPFTDFAPGLENKTIISLYVEEKGMMKTIWAGTLKGISRYDFSSEEWENFNWAGNYFAWGGVSEIDEAKDGRIIACTSGGGVAIWDQSSWRFFQNNNSPMRSNTALTFAESPMDDFWFGLGYPTEPGGYLMRLDHSGKWQRYVMNTSGYAEGEPLDLEFDHFERLWVATNGKGIQTYYRKESSGSKK